MAERPERLVAARAEAQALGLVVYGRVSTEALARDLAVSDFWKDPHRILYGVLTSIHGPVAPSVLVERLRAIGKLDNVGGVDGLGRLLPEMVTPDWDDLVRIVRGRAALREMYDAGQAVMNDIAAAPDLDDPSEIVDLCEARLARATEPLRRKLGPYRGLWSEADLRAWLTGRLSEKPGGDAVGAWPETDRLCKVPTSTLTVVAARTSVGKSAAALSLADRWALQGEHVGYQVAEDTAQRLWLRRIALHSGISTRRIEAVYLGGERGEGAKGLIECVEAWQEYLERSPGRVQFDDTPAPTVELIRMQARRLAAEGVTRFFVDHALELKPPGWIKRRHEQLEHIVKGLRDLAAELGIAVILLTQLNRGAEHREGPPKLSDLKESGAIEEAARLVWLLDRPGVDTSERLDHWHRIDCHVAKATHGSRGIVPLIFEPERTLVRPMTNRERQIHERAVKLGVTWHEQARSEGLTITQGSAMSWPDSASVPL